MSVWKLPKALIFAAALSAPILQVTAAPVQEVVSGFITPPEAPTQARVIMGPDGFIWTTFSGGGPTGNGGILRLGNDLDKAVFLFNNSVPATYGDDPRGGLMNDGAGNVWGTTASGGRTKAGTVFRYNWPSKTFTLIHDFADSTPQFSGNQPTTTLTSDGKGWLWGTTMLGGNSGKGTIYKVNLSTGAFVGVMELTGKTGAYKGASPAAALTLDPNGFLWGVTEQGGADDGGTVFKIDPSTGAFTTIWEFTTSAGGDQGYFPAGTLLYNKGVFWGTTVYGGSGNAGTIFKLDPTAGSLTTAISFQAGTQGANPYAGMENDGSDRFLGTNKNGGTSNKGTIFYFDPSNTSLSILHQFSTSSARSEGSPTAQIAFLPSQLPIGVTDRTIFIVGNGGFYQNTVTFGSASDSDHGSAPAAGLTPTTPMWSTTSQGGASGNGLIYQIDQGTSLRTTIANFTGKDGILPGRFPNSEQNFDQSGYAYGTTRFGGSQDAGTIYKFSVPPFNTGTPVYDFSKAQASDGSFPNGKWPIGGLIYDSQTLVMWGTTSAGGTQDAGTIYRIDKQTGAFTNVLSFPASGVGGSSTGPTASMIDDGLGYLWGTTFTGGANNLGTVFKVRKSTGALTTLVSFSGSAGSVPGQNPSGRLVDDGGGYIWGVTADDNDNATNSSGTIYKINKTSGAFISVSSFATNGAGRLPKAGLTTDGKGYLWGTTFGIPAQSISGTVYKVAASNGAVTKILDLNSSLGDHPAAGSLILATDGNFYGTASTGGPGGAGSVFRIRVGPTPITLPATGITPTTATLNGTVCPNGNNPTTVKLEYSDAPAFPNPKSIVLSTNATGTTPIPFSYTMTGLPSYFGYYYRFTASNADNSVVQNGALLHFSTTNNVADLYTLDTTIGALTPAFSSNVTQYFLNVRSDFTSISINPRTYDAQVTTVKVNGVSTPSNQYVSVPVPAGGSHVRIDVTATDGVTTKSYDIALFRLPSPVHLTAAAAGAAAVTTDHLIPSGNISFSLDYQPTPGTILRVIDQTGLDLNQGFFANLAQGQVVSLPYNGGNYRFIANYYGGSGNDLVLQWADSKLYVWGANDSYQLGQPGNFQGLAGPVAVDATGILAGRTPLLAAAGETMAMAAFDNGLLAAWGSRNLVGSSYALAGNLGTPYAVDTSGILNGKTIISMAAGYEDAAVVCSDGTIASWGLNSGGQLGNGSLLASQLPTEVLHTGALAGKTAIAITAGVKNHLVLCTDGTVVGWGSGQEGTWAGLGSGSNPTTLAPVAVDTSGVLAGKKVVSISSGRNHTLALCSDGTLVSWGYNSSGQLGNGTNTTSNVPVKVDVTGVLAGKTIVAVAAGGSHSLALCSDGAIAAWGAGAEGELGNGGSINQSVPVLVSRAGPLSGVLPLTISAGEYHSSALCSDGSVVTWGYNGSGQLGNPVRSQSLIPVLAARPSVAQPYLASFAGSIASEMFGIAASPAMASISGTNATQITDFSATLGGTVNANGLATTISFAYGTTSSYGTVVAASPASLSGLTDVPVTAAISGLRPGTVYHYQIFTTGLSGENHGPDMTFTTTTGSALSALGVGSSTLTPVFNEATTQYSATVGVGVESVSITPVAKFQGASIVINGKSLPNGSGSMSVPLSEGSNLVTITVTSADGLSVRNYIVSITRIPATLTLSSSDTAPVTAASFEINGATPSIQLDFTPAPGAPLTLVNNTGITPIRGLFAALLPGQPIDLTFQRTTYHYVVSYTGGNGNDLVLMWKNTFAASWGYNNYGQLGNGTTSPALVPSPIVPGALAGKTITSISTGYSHALAMTADGSLFAWGSNDSGQLGIGASPAHSTPVAVTGGALTGKRVIAISAGGNFSLALCSDGTLASWGDDFYAQLGDTSGQPHNLPISISGNGDLAGRQVVAIGAGFEHCLVLCADGSLVAWGQNTYGECGGSGSRVLPTLVDASGNLAGKSVTAISVGSNFNLILCSDGSLLSWGSNSDYQLGIVGVVNTVPNQPTPVIQNHELLGKTPVEIATGVAHAGVLCSDGSVYTWGTSYSGHVQDGVGTSTHEPAILSTLGDLAGRKATHITALAGSGMALTSDGSLVTWGDNYYGQLGIGKTTEYPPSAPVLVDRSISGAGNPFTLLCTGEQSYSPTALVSIPAPTVDSVTATTITGISAVLQGGVDPMGSSAVAVSFEYFRTGSDEQPTVVPVDPVSGTGSQTVSVPIGGLTPNTYYTYRLIAADDSGLARSADATFRTLNNNPRIAGLSTGAAALYPGFNPATLFYRATVPSSVSSVTFSATPADTNASVSVAGGAPVKGGGDFSVNLQTGLNTIVVTGTAEDGVTIRTYTFAITRLPEVFALGGSAPALTLDGFVAAGNPANFSLTSAPATGSTLTVVRNTGLPFIQGVFTNLAQGQIVTLDFNGQRYRFVANYYGGSGNDLVLQWADTTALAWGSNSYGEAGTGNTDKKPVKAPLFIADNGALAGMTVMTLSPGYLHSLALCSDGSLLSWGYNSYGQLGNGSTTNQNLPVQVDRSGVLAGKTIAAIAAGSFHNLALCSDGTLAAWGYNNQGQLGNGTRIASNVPVAVTLNGALTDKSVIAIAAGAYQSFALCSDGTVAAWGYNDEGELGDGTTVARLTPVVLAGDLAGKTVASISAGQYHALALCSDGTLVGWGYNRDGQLATTSGMTVSSPAVIAPAGALVGKSIATISAGGSHTLVLTSDGRVVSWGLNTNGQLGNGTVVSSATPVVVNLSGKTAVSVIASANSSYALTSDGNALAWGANASGQLGFNDTTDHPSPVGVGQGQGGDPSWIYAQAASGSSATQALGLKANPAQSISTTSVGSSLTGIVAWRVQQFGSSDNAGNAADLADPDHDGLSNLMEYAFGLDPKHSSADQMPHWQKIGDELVISFTQPSGVTGVAYAAQVTADLTASTPWQAVTDTGVAPQHTFRVPIVKGQNRFVRLQVTAP